MQGVASELALLNKYSGQHLDVVKLLLLRSIFHSCAVLSIFMADSRNYHFSTPILQFDNAPTWQSVSLCGMVIGRWHVQNALDARQQMLSSQVRTCSGCAQFFRMQQQSCIPRPTRCSPLGQHSLPEHAQAQPFHIDELV